MTYTYGRHPSDDTWQRREYIHQHIISQRGVDHALPTNTRSVYYVGKGTAWEADAPGQGRKPSQYVSDACQWLIDHGLVSEDEITDANGHLEEHIGVANLLDEVLDSARHLAMCPWSPNPIPVLMCVPGRKTVQCIAQLVFGGEGARELCRVAPIIDVDAPIGYVGDWNRTGFDIERNAERFLRERGWDGEWTRLLVTDTQAPGLSPKDHTDGRDGKSGLSAESAAMPVGAARALILGWLDEQLPVAPDADESLRAEIVEALETIEAQHGQAS